MNLFISEDLVVVPGTMPKLRTSGESPFMDFRANAPHFWGWSYVNAKKFIPAALLEHTGIVSGDPHAGGNIADLYIPRRRLSIAQVDIDDSGRGPFILNFMRLLIGAKISLPDTNKLHKKMLEAYLSGLNDEPYDMPQSARKELDLSVAEVEELVAEFVDKNTKKDRFSYKTLNLLKIEDADEPIKKLAQRAQTLFKEAFPKHKVLDQAYRIKTTGGSQNLLRIWFLTEDENSKRQIYEIKALGVPALAYYQQQLPHEQRLAEAVPVLWDTPTYAPYSMIRIDGKPFWLRPRFKSILSFDSSEDMSQREEAEFVKWTLYVAYVEGRKQAMQGDISYRYIEALAALDFDDLLECIKEFSSAYRDVLEQAH